MDELSLSASLAQLVLGEDDEEAVAAPFDKPLGLVASGRMSPQSSVSTDDEDAPAAPKLVAVPASSDRQPSEIPESTIPDGNSGDDADRSLFASALAARFVKTRTVAWDVLWEAFRQDRDSGGMDGSGVPWDGGISSKLALMGDDSDSGYARQDNAKAKSFSRNQSGARQQRLQEGESKR